MKKFLIITIVLIITTTIGCKKFPDLGSGYRIDYSGRSNYIQIENSNNEIIIGDNIVNYSYDANYILIGQKPPDSIPDPTHNYGDWEIAYNKSTFRQYWIIDKKLKSIFDEKTKTYSNVYGPFKKNEYLKKLVELKVPQTLKIEEK